MGPQTERQPGTVGVVMGRQRSTGSGFVIDPEGYIITNAHVVNGAQRIQIVLPSENADGTLTTALSIQDEAGQRQHRAASPPNWTSRC